MSHTPTQDHGVITKDPDILGGARETAVRALEHAKSLVVSQLQVRRLLEGKRKVPRLRSG